MASATALPFRSAAFDLIAAFEVIEHLTDWRALLHEARRLIQPEGMFLISTPNKRYYAESRAAEGPNPFHVHEFEYAEFQDALGAVFPHVTILLQNRLESQAFYPHATFTPVDARIDSARGSPAEAHFFIGICTVSAKPSTRSFLYVPRAANLLREREQHVLLLQKQLSDTKRELDGVVSERAQLIEAQHQLQTHLEEHNRWALQLERDHSAALQRIVELQDLLQADQAKALQMAGAYEQAIVSLERENRLKTEWALETETRLSAALTAKCDELAETVRLLDRAEATVVERTAWAQDLDRRLTDVQQRLHLAAGSRWVKLGRAVGIGPKLTGDPG